MTVEVSYEELKPSLDAAYKTIGQQIQVPGCRKGKVPTRIIDQRVGRGAVLQEAVNEALPQFYGQAVDENNVRPLGQPEIELRDYSNITVEVDPVAADDDEVAERITALRQRFGTLKGVERPAQEGDFVSIDLSATIEGEEIDSVNVVSYEVGTNNMIEGIDEALVGMSAGETTEFSAPL